MQFLTDVHSTFPTSIHETHKSVLGVCQRVRYDLNHTPSRAWMDATNQRPTRAGQPQGGLLGFLLRLLLLGRFSLHPLSSLLCPSLHLFLLSAFCSGTGKQTVDAFKGERWIDLAASPGGSAGSALLAHLYEVGEEAARQRTQRLVESGRTPGSRHNFRS